MVEAEEWWRTSLLANNDQIVSMGKRFGERACPNKVGQDKTDYMRSCIILVKYDTSEALKIDHSHLS
ncbi:hypothetical protein TNCV_4694471 [Trichonephila clavipes]|nr:hypothetical protein TNCV_4694471 [Trichonephila clavipes]